MSLRIIDLVNELFRKYDTYDKIEEYWGTRIEYTIFELIDDYYGDSRYDLNKQIIVGRTGAYDMGKITFHIIPNLCWIVYPSSESAGYIRSIRYIRNEYRQRGPTPFHELLESDFSKYDKKVEVNDGPSSDFMTSCRINKELPTIMKLGKFQKMIEHVPNVRYLFKFIGDDIQMHIKNEDIVRKT